MHAKDKDENEDTYHSVDTQTDSTHSGTNENQRQYDT
jgi:hypothetical protein